MTRIPGRVTSRRRETRRCTRECIVSRIIMRTRRLTTLFLRCSLRGKLETADRLLSSLASTRLLWLLVFTSLGSFSVNDTLSAWFATFADIELFYARSRSVHRDSASWKFGKQARVNKLIFQSICVSFIDFYVFIINKFKDSKVRVIKISEICKME